MAETSIQRRGGVSPAEPELAALALRFARRVHLDQHRQQTHEQFVEHPIRVAELLADAGYGEAVLAAAYIHDVVEKTTVELDEIRKRFGPEVARLVEALTDDPLLSDYAERKRALRRRVLAAGEEAAAIYAADRVANMRDWRSAPPDVREELASRLGTTLAERIGLWREDLEDLSRLEGELPFMAELEVGLRELRADLAGQAG
jgi:(p)ppGpp synthase/HD superfamily hydrolase